MDEFEEVARISGLKGIERKSIGHALNMRAVAMKVAREEGLDYQHSTLIVAHLGGGNTISIHYKGKMIDLISDDEGAILNGAYRWFTVEIFNAAVLRA